MSNNSLSGLSVRIGADTSGFEAGTRRAASILGRFNQSVNQLSSSMEGRASAAANRFSSSVNDLNERIARFETRLRNSSNAADYTATLAQLDQLRARLNAAQAAANFQRSMDSIRGFGESLTNVGKNMTVGVTAPLVGAGIAALKAYGDMDSLSRALKSVEGTTDKTNARLSELQKVARLPGIGFEEAIKGDVRLRSVGISADLSKKALVEFANAIATTGGGKAELNSVTVQLAQLSAKGKVLAQDLRPIIEAAPAVASALKKLYGTVDSETISKALQKQGKSSTDFINILVNEMSKLPRITGGFNTSMENFADNAKVNAAKFGNAINTSFNVEGKLNSVADAFTSLTDKFVSLSPAGQTTILTMAGIAAAIGPVLLGVGAATKAIPLLISGFNALRTTVLTTNAALGAGVVLLAAYTAYKAVEVFSRDTSAEAIATNTARFTADYVKQSKERQAAIEAETRASAQAYARQIQIYQKIYDTQKALGKTTTSNSVFEKSRAEMEKASEKLEAYNLKLGAMQARLKAIAEINSKNAVEVVNEEAATAQLGLLEKLRKELTDVTALRESATSEKEIAGHKQRMVFLEAEIERLEQLGLTMQKTKLEAINRFGSNPVDKVNATDRSRFETLGGKQTQGPGLDENFYTKVVTGVKKATQGIYQEITPIDTALRALDLVAIDVSGSLSGLFTSVLENLGNSTGGFEGYLTNVIKAVADFGKQLGSMLIAQGVAAVAAKKLIAYPVTAIAAGAALVAISSVAVGALKGAPDGSGGGTARKMAAGGIAYGPTYAMVGEYAGASRDPEVVAPLSKLKNIIGEGGGKIELYGEFVQRGPDLVAAIKQQNRKDGRVTG